MQQMIEEIVELRVRIDSRGNHQFTAQKILEVHPRAIDFTVLASPTIRRNVYIILDDVPPYLAAAARKVAVEQGASAVFSLPHPS